MRWRYGQLHALVLLRPHGIATGEQVGPKVGVAVIMKIIVTAISQNHTPSVQTVV